MTAQQLVMIPIGDIKASPDNPRKDLGNVDELAGSIKAVGILEPLIVAPGGKNGDQVLIAGERRLAAAKKAGLKEVPVIVRSDLSPTQILEARLIENLQRKDLDPLEEAQAYKKLLDLGYSEHKLAERLGRSQSHISKRVSLLQLPEPAKKELDAGGITIQDALELTKLTAHPDRIRHAISERKRNGYFRDMKQAVDQELELQKELDARAATRARLQSAGVKILREEDYVHFYGKPERALAGQGEHDCISLTVDQHKEKSCHAAIIVRGGKVVWVCKHPANHPSAKTTSRVAGLSPAEKAQRTKRLEDQRAAKVARDARAETMKTLLKNVKKGASAEHILIQLVAIAGSEEARIAEELLQLPQPKLGSVYSPEVVLKYAERGDKELWRAALALALGAGESNLRTGFAYGRSKTKVARHLKMLEKAGYRVTAADRSVTK